MLVFGFQIPCSVLQCVINHRITGIHLQHTHILPDEVVYMYYMACIERHVVHAQVSATQSRHAFHAINVGYSLSMDIFQRQL
jgi:hypothetical protein